MVRKKMEALISINYVLLLLAAVFAPRLYFWRFDLYQDLFFLGSILSLALLVAYQLYRRDRWRFSVADILLFLLVLSLMPQAIAGPFRQAPLNFILLVSYGLLAGRSLKAQVLPVTLPGVNVLLLALLFGQVGSPLPFRGPFYNASLLSAFLLVCIPFHIGLARRLIGGAPRKRLAAVLILLVALANCIVIAVNQTRACLLVIAAGLPFLVLYASPLKNKYTYLLSLALPIGALVFFSLALKRDSTAGRWQIWQITFRHIADIPLTGLGYGTFQNHYLDWQSEWFSEGHLAGRQLADANRYAFNEYLQFYCEWGIIRWLLLLTVLVLAIGRCIRVLSIRGCIRVLAIRRCNHEPTRARLAAAAAFGALLLNCLFTYSLHCPVLLILFATLLSVLTEDPDKRFIAGKKIVWSGTAGAISILALSFLLYVRYLRADREWARRHYEQAYPILSENGEFLYNYGITALTRPDTATGIRLLERGRHFLNTPELNDALGYAYMTKKQYGQAKAFLEYSINAVPNRFIPRQTLMQVYLGCGDTASALRMASEIMRLPVKVGSAYVTLARQEAAELLSHRQRAGCDSPSRQAGGGSRSLRVRDGCRSRRVGGGSRSR